MPYRLHYTTIILFLFITTQAQRFWVATTGGLWSNAANWSATSGGPGGAGLPAGMAAIFDGASGSVGNCTIDVAVNVTAFNVLGGYTGTIIQGANAINISGNSLWAGGLFSGGSAAIVNSGTLGISGCNFLSTSATLSVGNTFSYLSGNFSHNNGTTIFYNTSFATTGSPVFNHLKISATSNVITVNNSFTVAGDFTFDGASGGSGDINIAASATVSVIGTIYYTGTSVLRINSGTLAAKGNILISNTHPNGGGTGIMLIDGANNQNLSCAAAFGQGRLPSVIINKTTGVLSLVGIISVIGPSWTYLSGTLNAGTSTVNFTKQSGGSNITISGTHTLNNVIVSSSFGTTTINNNLTAQGNFTIDGVSASNDLNITNTVTVLGNLFNTGNQNIKINVGLLDAKGDIINTNVAPVGGGTGTVSITGTGNQLWSCSTAGDGLGSFPNVLINKPSGILTLSGIISSLGPNWTFSAGTISPGTSTVCLYDNGAPIIMSGSHTLNDIIIYPFSATTNIINNLLAVNNMTIDGSGTHDLNITSTLTVNGKLTINGANPVRINTGIVHSKGDILTTNTSNTSGGTATLILNGTSNQTITGTGVALQSRLPNTTNIAKPSGAVYIGGGVPFYFYSVVNFVNGILFSTSSQLAFFYSGSTANGASSLSFVSGPVRKRGNTAFVFPIGKSTEYAPIRISAPSNVTHAFTAEYFYTNPNPTYSVSLKDPTLNNVSLCEYWILDRTTGTSNVSVTPSWDTRSCGVGNISALRVARWDGTMWKDHGNGGTSGTLAAGTITTSGVVTAFSPFTLASSTPMNPLPIELISNTAKCFGNDVQISWQTIYESNTTKFEIEKSDDANTWKNIGTVNASGISYVAKSYELTDSYPGNWNYYRIKVVYNDNSSEYSDVFGAGFCTSKGKSNIHAFPNPTNGLIKIVAPAPYSVLTVFDLLGRQVFATVMQGKSHELNMGELSEGVYTAEVVSGLENEVIKIVYTK